MTTLEKIKAEIEQIQGNEYEISDMQGNRYKYETIEKSEALQIIDKYADQEPKTGHWEFFCQHWRKCSECGYPHKFAEDWNYCPNCGVRMERSGD